jgi:hypothetical protein
VWRLAVVVLDELFYVGVVADVAAEFVLVAVYLWESTSGGSSKLWSSSPDWFVVVLS